MKCCKQSIVNGKGKQKKEQRAEKSARISHHRQSVQNLLKEVSLTCQHFPEASGPLFLSVLRSFPHGRRTGGRTPHQQKSSVQKILSKSNAQRLTYSYHGHQGFVFCHKNDDNNNNNNIIVMTEGGPIITGSQGVSAVSSYGAGILLLGLPFTPYATHLLTFLVPSLVLGICHFVALRMYLRR
jgi:hypothetical protein